MKSRSWTRSKRWVHIRPETVKALKRRTRKEVRRNEKAFLEDESAWENGVIEDSEVTNRDIS